MYTTSKYVKEAMFPHTGTWTLNEFMMVGGQCTSDNLPPRYAAIQYAWRSPSLGIQEQIARILAQNAAHAAAIAHCRHHVRWITKTRVGLPNRALAELVYRNLKVLGPPAFGDEARRFGRDIQRALGIEPMDDPFIESCGRLIEPAEHDRRLRDALPPWQQSFTSDDYVEYTWHAPTARLFVGRPRLRPPQPGYDYPAWTTNAIGGLPACIDPMTFAAGKTIAGSLVDLLTYPDELARAQGEFEERTGGGVGGTHWVAPLLPRDFAPPVDLRWPEYVTTPRGDEWWIPTPAHSAG
jgi:aminobenzoyl-glutamate utilization protein B